MFLRCLGLCMIAVVLTCCNSAEPESSRIKGTVRHIPLEGGFYGIVSEDGKKFDPLNLPEAFKKDGLTIRFIPEPCDTCMSMRMWGDIVRLKKLSDA